MAEDKPGIDYGYAKTTKRGRTGTFSGFGGGLNLGDDGISIGDDELQVADNIRYDMDESVKLRAGSWTLPPLYPWTTARNTDIAAIGWSFPYNTSSGQLYVLVHSGVDGYGAGAFFECYHWKSEVGGWTKLFFPDGATSSKTNTPVRVARFGNEIIVPGVKGTSGRSLAFNPVYARWRELRTGATGYPATDFFRVAVVFQQRLVLCGPNTGAVTNDVHRSTIYFSAQNTSVNWSTSATASAQGGTLLIGAGDGGWIMDAIVYKGKLYVFKSTGIYVVTETASSTSPLKVDKLTDAFSLWQGPETNSWYDWKGTERTVRECSGYLVFMDRQERIQAYNGSTFQEISAPIQPWIKGFTRGADWTAGSFGNRYYITNRHRRSTRGEVYVFDFAKQVWLRETYPHMYTSYRLPNGTLETDKVAIQGFISSDAESKFYILAQSTGRMVGQGSPTYYAGWVAIDAQREGFYSDTSGGNTQHMNEAGMSTRRTIPMRIRTKDYDLAAPAAMKRIKSFRLSRAKWAGKGWYRPVLNGNLDANVDPIGSKVLPMVEVGPNKGLNYTEHKRPMSSRVRYLGLELKNYNTHEGALPTILPGDIGDCAFASFTAIWKQEKVR